VSIERYLVEVIHEPTAVRATCLRCGRQIRPVEYGAQMVVSPLTVDHDCTAQGIFATDVFWREIVRDAFLAGRDAEAIEIICHEMNLVSP
jgi:hypothetical protein